MSSRDTETQDESGSQGGGVILPRKGLWKIFVDIFGYHYNGQKLAILSKFLQYTGQLIQKKKYPAPNVHNAELEERILYKRTQCDGVGNQNLDLGLSLVCFPLSLKQNIKNWNYMNPAPVNNMCEKWGLFYITVEDVQV